MQQKEILQRLSNIESSLEQQRKPLTVEEACKYLGVSRSCLYKLTSSKEIPYYKPNGKMNYFKESELKDWMLRNRIRTKSELEQCAINHVMLGGING
jgi:excisionase family DNA binding protein